MPDITIPQADQAIEQAMRGDLSRFEKEPQQVMEDAWESLTGGHVRFLNAEALDRPAMARKLSGFANYGFTTFPPEIDVHEIPT